MSMPRAEKQYEKLDSLEQDFRNLLVKTLQKAKETGSYAPFLHPEANAFPDVYDLKKEPQKSIIELSERISELRSAQGDDPEGGIVGLHKKYAVELNNVENSYRLGPKKLAEKFLNEI